MRKQKSMDSSHSGRYLLLGLIVIITASFFLSGCSSWLEPINYGDGGDFSLQRFSSEEDINDFLSRSSFDGYDHVSDRSGGSVELTESEAADVSGDDTGAEDNVASAEDGEIDYSKTNVQVEGVDEADIVKTDGTHIYYVSDDALYVIKISEGNESGDPEEVHRIADDELDIMDIFVTGDRLVVMGNTRHPDDVPDMPRPSVPGGHIGIPHYSHDSDTFISLYDISDKSDPELIDRIEADGRYQTSRLIEDKVYVISDKPVGDTFVPPVVVHRDKRIEIMPEEIYHYDTDESSYDLSLIMEIGVDDGSLEKTPVLKGSTDNTYMSGNNIYLAGRKNVPYIREQERIIDEVYREVLPSDIILRIDEIDDYDIRDSTKINEINHVVHEYITGLDEDDATSLLEDMEEMISTIREEIKKERDRTIIHRISIGDGMEYETSGEVKGHVDDQFSMDEHDGFFRIATTSGSFWDSDDPSENNLYVLDMDLDVVGELEGLAPEERIHSARFMGDTMHLVTFRTVDPLFSIDISDPRDPVVEGELKIPGVSDYLHPVEDNHLIGVGRDVKELSDERTVTGGVKLSLFDISDMDDPKEISTHVIGGSGSYTPVLNNHRSFLFDRSRGLVILPVEEREDTEIEERDGREFLPRGDTVFQGAYIFEADVDSGFDLKGKITHLDKGSNETHDDYRSEIVRSLIIRDRIYTLSMGKLMVHDLDSLDELAALELSGIDEKEKEVEPRKVIEEPEIA
ncbi:MAG: beta-propeller domain-containing protein [Candidatus Woesearchaeota archaeon]